MSTLPKTDIKAVSVRLARSPEEIEQAQRLRYKVFYEEYEAQPTEEMVRLQKDVDDFDDVAEHLIVVNNTNDKEEIVGTYRLLRRDIAEKQGGFYSSGEYDLSHILNSGRPVLELGRSCVLPEFRTRPVLQLLWEGIADYITEHNIELMFGCASLHSTDVKNLAEPLSYMYHYHLAPEEIRVSALEERYIDMNMIPKEELNPKTILSALPPLLKGYLRVGAMVGDGAVIDPQFKTTDVFIIMPSHLVAQRYKSHYERKNQKPFPGAENTEGGIAAFARGTA